jgi:hypothetical protein
MMNFSWLILWYLFLLSHQTFASIPPPTNDVDKNKEYDLQWVSSTGGWRTLSGNMGLTYIFSQLGLISSTHCNFTSISGASGASWFATQLMYSQPFFDRLIGDKNSINPTSVKSFAEQWMTSLALYHQSIQKRKYITCNILKQLESVSDDLSALTTGCKTLRSVNGDWAEHIQRVFLRATTEYGDSLFVQHKLSYDNLLTPFKNTEFYIHFALSTTSIIRSKVLPLERLVYIAPSQQSDTPAIIYTVPIGYVYAVKRNATEPHYRVLTEPDSLPLWTRSTKVRLRQPFQVDHYSSLFMKANTSLHLTLPNKEKFGGSSYLLRTPFGGDIPTTSQINAATSGWLGPMSGLTPSLLAQSLKSIKVKYGIDVGKLIPNLIYNLPSLQATSICSQWPSKCGVADGRFVDGSFVDIDGLAISIGQYQVSNPNTNGTKKLKIVNVQSIADSENYFSNGDAEPGDIHWPIEYFLPERCKVIFQETKDKVRFQSLKDMKLLFRCINTTTIDNPVFGVRAGLAVEILELFLPEDGDLLLFDFNKRFKLVDQLGKMAYSIANSNELKNIIKEFVKK